MFHGSMVALVTPMSKNGEIDYRAVERLVDFHLDNNTDALVVAGTTGEASALSFAEKKSLLKHVVGRVNDRIPVIAGTATNATQTTIELTEMAMSVGADACLIMTPAYVKPTQAGLIAHYQAIAQAVALPIILYNVPGRTACDLLPETIIELARVANIIGVKEATGDMDRVKQIVEACGDKMDIYSGDDATCCELMRLGGRGVISVTANVAPSLMAAMAKAALAGDDHSAREINQKLESLHRDLFIESNPIPVKWALCELGLIEEGIRLPLTPLQREHQQVVRDALKAAQ